LAALAAAALTATAVVLMFLLDRSQRRFRHSSEARHAERERIARDVHDTILQGAQALLFRLQMWEEDPTIPESLRREITGVVQQTRSMIVAGRERILMIRRADAQPADFRESLAAIGNEASAGKSATFEISLMGAEKELTADTQDQLIAIAREAVRNAYQHAGPTSIVVCVQYLRRALILSVADDGLGIDQSALEGRVHSGHFGLIGMRERAKQLGARLHIHSRPDKGTRIEVIVPAGSAFRDAFRWPWQRHGPTSPGEALCDRAP
jgi:signal transduction histidine kinase